MDKIYIEDLEVYGYHGVNPEEKSMGQRFLISLELMLDLYEAGTLDELDKTVNYAELCYAVEEQFKKEKYHLIEKAAEELSSFILNTYSLVKKVKVLIKKPWAPIGKPIKYAAVEIVRGWHKAYIALGSNLGDRRSNLEEAIKAIAACGHTKVTKASKTYETEPVGYLDQENFLNCAVEVETLLTPEELMKQLFQIEKNLKRERVIRWGPRTIDLDIILFDDIVTDSEDIIIPHPRMHERLFVLNPLSDIAPYAVHPILKKRIITLKEEFFKEEKL